MNIKLLKLQILGGLLLLSKSKRKADMKGVTLNTRDSPPRRRVPGKEHDETTRFLVIVGSGLEPDCPKRRGRQKPYCLLLRHNVVLLIYNNIKEAKKN